MRSLSTIMPSVTAITVARLRTSSASSCVLVVAHHQAVGIVEPPAAMREGARQGVADGVLGRQAVQVALRAAAGRLLQKGATSGPMRMASTMPMAGPSGQPQPSRNASSPAPSRMASRPRRKAAARVARIVALAGQRRGEQEVELEHAVAPVARQRAEGGVQPVERRGMGGVERVAVAPAAPQRVPQREARPAVAVLDEPVRMLGEQPRAPARDERRRPDAGVEAGGRGSARPATACRAETSRWLSASRRSRLDSRRRPARSRTEARPQRCQRPQVLDDARLGDAGEVVVPGAPAHRRPAGRVRHRRPRTASAYAASRASLAVAGGQPHSGASVERSPGCELRRPSTDRATPRSERKPSARRRDRHRAECTRRCARPAERRAPRRERRFLIDGVTPGRSAATPGFPAGAGGGRRSADRAQEAPPGVGVGLAAAGRRACRSTTGSRCGYTDHAVGAGADPHLARRADVQRRRLLEGERRGAPILQRRVQEKRAADRLQAQLHAQAQLRPRRAPARPFRLQPARPAAARRARRAARRRRRWRRGSRPVRRPRPPRAGALRRGKRADPTAVPTRS